MNTHATQCSATRLLHARMHACTHARTNACRAGLVPWELWQQCKHGWQHYFRSAGGSRFFSNLSGYADGERRGPNVDLKVPKEASPQDISDANLPIRSSPSAFAVGMPRKVQNSPPSVRFCRLARWPVACSSCLAQWVCQQVSRRQLDGTVRSVSVGWDSQVAVLWG